jgi:hypothetical protein
LNRQCHFLFLFDPDASQRLLFARRDGS